MVIFSSLWLRKIWYVVLGTFAPTFASVFIVLVQLDPYSTLRCSPSVIYLFEKLQLHEAYQLLIRIFPCFLLNFRFRPTSRRIEVDRTCSGASVCSSSGPSFAVDVSIWFILKHFVGLHKLRVPYNIYKYHNLLEIKLIFYLEK